MSMMGLYAVGGSMDTSVGGLTSSVLSRLWLITRRQRHPRHSRRQFPAALAIREEMSSPCRCASCDTSGANLKVQSGRAAAPSILPCLEGGHSVSFVLSHLDVFFPPGSEVLLVHPILHKLRIQYGRCSSLSGSKEAEGNSASP
jgi:hypothetical protein